MPSCYNPLEPVRAYYAKALQHRGLRQAEPARAIVSPYTPRGYEK